MNRVQNINVQADEKVESIRAPLGTRGATTTEYLAVIILASLALLGGIELFGGGLANQVGNAANTLSSAGDHDASTDAAPEPRAQTGQGYATGSDGGAHHASDSDANSGSEDGSPRTDPGSQSAFAGDPAGERSASTNGSSNSIGPIFIVLGIIILVVIGAIKFSKD